VIAGPLPAKDHTPRQRRAGASAVKATPASKHVSAGEAYRLSRIQAEGWNAARRFTASTLDRLETARIESLNPYASEPERARWRAGFTSALAA
jgi:hypothetical protein